MARLEQVERDKLGARQQALYDEIMRTRPRGKLSGPFSVWIHRPDIAEPANAMANCFRVSPKLDKRLIELIVLLVCRDATAQYAWSAISIPRARPVSLARPSKPFVRGAGRNSAVTTSVSSTTS